MLGGSTSKCTGSTGTMSTIGSPITLTVYAAPTVDSVQNKLSPHETDLYTCIGVPSSITNSYVQLFYIHINTVFAFHLKKCELQIYSVLTGVHSTACSVTKSYKLYWST